MSSDSPKTTTGSKYRPYYSYSEQLPPTQPDPAQNPSPKQIPAAGTYPKSVSAIPKPVKEQIPAIPAPEKKPVSNASKSENKPVPQKSGSGGKKFWLILAAAFVLLLFATVGLFVLANTDSSADTSYSGVSGNKIAVIHISGPMYSGEYYYGSGYAGSDQICRNIRAAANNKSVKAIVLRIDSPGGTAASAQEINYEIQRAQAMGKPVVTSMGGQATSAAYCVASQTDYIYATKSTLTGSIGSIGIHYDLTDVYEREGIKVDVFKSGELKDMGAEYRPLTAEEERYWQYIIDESLNVFVDDVAAGRNMTRDEVLKLADGRVYLATDAKNSGLIDDFGNLYDAIDKAAELAGMKNYTVYVMDRVSLSSLIF